MLIAKQKRTENIAEYLIYMWQVEDIIRAHNFDMEQINRNIISKFNVPDKQRNEMQFWYENLIEMMHLEQVEKSGHIQPLKNIITDLTTLHIKLLNSTLHLDYRTKYSEAVGYIAESHSKMQGTAQTEIEVCLNMLYGILLLKLNKKSVSDQTMFAISKISAMLALLAHKYKQYEKDELEF